MVWAQFDLGSHGLGYTNELKPNQGRAFTHPWQLMAQNKGSPSVVRVSRSPMLRSRRQHDKDGDSSKGDFETTWMAALTVALGFPCLVPKQINHSHT
ncbi:hypothetical protein V6N12_065836 [Hibiscus sabdariffa]|uniref:Uncharacterized protein n=1 Tax=Hibiscus sabdariffa TaxID=183260 RepID=A0ABR2G9Z8_9ROSI